MESMSKPLPEGCPRKLECVPLHRIESDDDPKTFVCCGLPGELDDFDPYRFCFKTADTDTMYDHNELDLLDMVEVIVTALSNAKRMKEPPDAQA